MTGSRGDAFAVSRWTSRSLRRDSLAWKINRFVCANSSCTPDSFFWAFHVTSLDPRLACSCGKQERSYWYKGQTFSQISFSFYICSGCLKTNKKHLYCLHVLSIENSSEEILFSWLVRDSLLMAVGRYSKYHKTVSIEKSLWCLKLIVSLLNDCSRNGYNDFCLLLISLPLPYCSLIYDYLYVCNTWSFQESVGFCCYYFLEYR